MRLVRASLLLACLLLAGLAHARDLREHAKPLPKGWHRSMAAPNSQRRGLRGSAATATSPLPTKLHTKAAYLDGEEMTPSPALEWFWVEGNDCTATCSNHERVALNGGYTNHAVCAVGVQDDNGYWSYFFGTKTWTPNQCEVAVASWEEDQEYFDAQALVGASSSDELGDFMCGCVSELVPVAWSTDGYCPEDAEYASTICRVVAEDEEGNERVWMGWVEGSYSTDRCEIVYEGESVYVDEDFDYLCFDGGVVV